MESGDAFRLLVAAEKKNPRVRSLAELARSRGIPVVEISAAALSAKLQGAKHQGVAVESEAESPLEMRELPSENAKENSLILALDGVTDPRNLGACLRVAAAFNADFVIVPRRRAAGLTPVAQKAASGAAISLCRVVNFARALEELKQRGFFIVGAAADAKRIYTTRIYRAPSHGFWAAKAAACGGSRAKNAICLREFRPPKKWNP